MTAGPAAGGPTPEQRAYDVITSALTRGWTDWAVTDGDVRKVSGALEQLPPASYRRVLERMDRDGLLATYVEEMPAEVKAQFLRQAEAKGFLTREPGRPAPRAPGSPPDGPALLRLDRALPGPLGTLVFESNVRAANAYAAAHEAYLGRYIEQVKQANSPLDVQKLGEPVARMSLEHGIDPRHPEHQAMAREWARSVRGMDDRSTAYVAVSERMADIAGQQRAGTFWLKAGTEVGFEFPNGTSLKRGTTWKGTSYGEARGDQATTLAYKAGSKESAFLKVGLSESDAGKRKTSIGIEKSIPQRGTSGLSVSSTGAIQTRIGVTEHLGAYSEVNPSAGSLEGGVSLKAKHSMPGGSVELKAELGIGFQGMRPSRAEDVARSHGVFAPVPELEARTPWEQLPKARQEFLGRNGWTPGLWRTALTP